jgi:hypothetical protein
METMTKNEENNNQIIIENDSNHGEVNESNYILKQ